MRKQQLKMIMNPLKISYRNEIITQLGDKNIKKERKYILKMILKAVDGLYLNGIYIYPNLIELFQIHGLKSSNLYHDIILHIIKKVENELNDNIKWINHRNLKKGNNMDKNIIMCFLLFTYREHFIEYLEDFFVKNKQSSEDKAKNLASNLQRIINDAPHNNNSKEASSIQHAIEPNNILKGLVDSKNLKKEINHDQYFKD